MIALALAASMSLQADDGFTRTWAEHQTAMEAQGISRPMAELAFEWSVGQGLLGQCRAYLESDDVDFWRQWWVDTALENSEIGRTIMAAGADAYTEGLEAALSEPLAPDHCLRVVETWVRDMRELTSK